MLRKGACRAHRCNVEGMAERKGQDGERLEDTPSLNIAMGEWGS